MKTLIVIPALNEAESLPAVIQQIRNDGPQGCEVLVVNDCSIDHTPIIAEALADHVLHLPIHLGIGGSVQAGLLYAHQHGFDQVVQFDGDGQHLASEIQRLLDALDEMNADLVIGSRFQLKEPKHYRSTFSRRVGITIIRGFGKMLTGFQVKDPTSGFRAFGKDAIQFLARFYPDHYPEPASTVLLLKRRMSVVEVPTRMRARIAGRSSIRRNRMPFYMAYVMVGMAMASWNMRRKPHPA